MKIKFDHINLTVGNLDEGITWYESIFGFKFVEGGVSQEGKRWAIVAYDDYMICMTEYSDRKKADAVDDSDAHQLYHIGIRVSDVNEWQDKVNRLNLKLYYGGVVEYPNSRSWYVHDPSGHEIEVSYSGGKSLQFPDHENVKNYAT